MGRKFNRGQEPQAGTTAPILTAAAFLTKYWDGDKDGFLHFGETLRDEDEEELSAFFSLINEKLKMTIHRRIQTDRGGKRYKYENFLRPKGPEGVKVILGGNMLQFIKDYQAGLFETNFTLDDLIAEAHKV
ncbi:hypothetical protein EOD41_00060 [Mucilaginibacter limnophilus]|uniref:Uncharacterized protein n=1 Tax=Mucilaginibacter limnophilus TaxID=1932778 RepID=A0A3S2V3F6_9SPHI|nr:hypothetical protein [Mucilaginibacter limnophilus]RVU02370.1 hypothetical protein EOD41_00060 [Mucilaginibacter limnophilus]